MDDIYQIEFVESLFSEMSATYEWTNSASSFGFSERWRWQMLDPLEFRPGMTVCDLMCGMGECWPALAASLPADHQLIAVDLSRGMLRGAEKNVARYPQLAITLREENALAMSLADESVDLVVCGFGLKTLSVEQRDQLAHEIRRILKPGGTYSLIEISVPRGWWLEWLYMFYLRSIIPNVGRLMLGNPENYRMLGIYTERFGDCREVVEIFARHGLSPTYHSYFFGCASGVSGKKEV